MMTGKAAIFFVAFALAAPLVAGQQQRAPSVPSPEKLPEVLQVEVLVFRHDFNAERAGALHEVQGFETPIPPEARDMFFPGDIFDAGSDDIHAVVDHKKFILHREAQRVRASRDLEFVHHAAWTQPLYSAGNAVYVRLLREQSVGLIDGAARVIAGQFNHIEVHLYYDLDSGRSVGTACDQASESEACVAAKLEPSSRILHISLDGATPGRRLLYLDHPVLGVLVEMKLTERSPTEIFADPVAPSTGVTAPSAPRP